MTIKETSSDFVNKFEKNNLPDAALEAEILLSAVLNKDKSYLYAHPEEKISFWQNFLLQRIVNQRLAGYSSAAITGHKWFYGLNFMVDKNVLIPRPETELMVDEALNIVKSKKLKVKNLIDIGTGSGCIIISLAKNSPDDKINFYGLDISHKALAVAKKNARKNDVGGRINFLYSDLLNTIDKSIFNNPVLITANLPYLTPEQLKNSPTIQKEPKIALLAGTEGFDCYRRLFQQIKEKIGLAKNKIFILCEIDETQRNSMEQLIRKNFPEAKILFKKDLNNCDRLVVVEL